MFNNECRDLYAEILGLEIRDVDKAIARFLRDGNIILMRFI